MTGFVVRNRNKTTFKFDKKKKTPCIWFLGKDELAITSFHTSSMIYTFSYKKAKVDNRRGQLSMYASSNKPIESTTASSTPIPSTSVSSYVLTLPSSL